MTSNLLSISFCRLKLNFPHVTKLIDQLEACHRHKRQWQEVIKAVIYPTLKFAENNFARVLKLNMHGGKTTANEAADSPHTKRKQMVCLTQVTHFNRPRAEVEGNIPHFCRCRKWTRNVRIRKASDRDLVEVLRDGREEGRGKSWPS